MTLLDDWPSLPPIRTSSNGCRVSCETLQPSDDLKFQQQQRLPPPRIADHSPPSTSSSTIDNLFSSSSDSRFLSCFAPRVASYAFPAKPIMSPGRDGIRRGSSDAASMFRSFVGFSGPIHHSGSLGHPGARSHSGPLKLNAGTNNIGHSGPLKGGSSSAKGYACSNAFTMIPPDVVGKKKPPGYESDEPTSPEVTCIGRVRRKKHCKAWDALVNEKGHGNRNGKTARSTESPRKDKPIESPNKATKPSRWKQAWGLRQTVELDNADLQKQSNVVDNLYIDLGRFSSACELSSRKIPGFDNLPVEEKEPQEPQQLQPPPSNCLLVMRNSYRGRYNYDDLLQPSNVNAFCSKEDHINPLTNSILWRRSGKSQLASNELQLEFQPFSTVDNS